MRVESGADECGAVGGFPGAAGRRAVAGGGE